MKKDYSSTWLVAQYIIKNDKCYIHEMKKKTKCNNVAERVRQLRQRQWEIDTILEGYNDGVPIYFYKLINTGSMPSKYR